MSDDYCGACQANEHDHCLDDPNLGETRQPCDCPACHNTHADPFLSPWQTNPTAGTPEDAAAQLDMARDLDRALKARDEDDSDRSPKSVGWWGGGDWS